MPKSYLSNEPAAMRAVMQAFDPHAQVRTRLGSYRANGHSSDKCELIVLGGKHRGALGRWLAGSTAHDLLRLGGHPVLVTGPGARLPRRVLAAVDLSEVAQATIGVAQRFAALFQADLDVILDLAAKIDFRHPDVALRITVHVLQLGDLVGIESLDQRLRQQHHSVGTPHRPALDDRALDDVADVR